MAEFDPQAYLNDSNNTTSSFDPSAYLAQDQQVNSGFDPQAYLASPGSIPMPTAPEVPEGSTFETRSALENAKALQASQKQLDEKSLFFDNQITAFIDSQTAYNNKKKQKRPLYPQKPIGYDPRPGSQTDFDKKYDQQLKLYNDYNTELKQLKSNRDGVIDGGTKVKLNPIIKYFKEAKRDLQNIPDPDNPTKTIPNPENITRQQVVELAKQNYLEEQKVKLFQDNVYSKVDEMIEGDPIAMIAPFLGRGLSAASKPKEQRDEVKKIQSEMSGLEKYQKNNVNYLNSLADGVSGINDQMRILNENFEDRSEYFKGINTESDPKKIEEFKNYLIKRKDYVQNFESLEEKRKLALAAYVDRNEEHNKKITPKLEKDYEKLSGYLHHMDKNGHLVTGLQISLAASGGEIINNLEQNFAEIIMLPQNLKGDNMFGDSKAAQAVASWADNFEEWRDEAYKEPVTNYLADMRNSIQEPPTFEEAGDGLGQAARWSAYGIANYLPQLGALYFAGPSGLATLSASASGASLAESRLSNKLGETDYSQFQRWTHATAAFGGEYVSEKFTLGLIKNAKGLAGKRVKENFSQYIKRVLAPKGLMKTGYFAGGEGISEVGAKILGENAADLFVYKKNVSLFNGVNEAFVTGLLMERTIAAPGIARGVMSPFTGKEFDQQLKDRENRKRDIEKDLKNPDLSIKVKEDLRKEYLDITKQQDNIIKKQHENVDMLDETEVQDLIDIDVEIARLKQAQDNVMEDKSLSDTQKEDMIKRHKQNEAVQIAKKNEILQKVEDPAKRAKREEAYKKQKEQIQAKIDKINKRRQQEGVLAEAMGGRAQKAEMKEFETVEEQQAFFNNLNAEQDAIDRAEIADMQEMLKNPNTSRADRVIIQNNLAFLRKELDARSRLAKSNASGFGFIQQDANGSFTIYLNKEKSIATNGNINVASHEFLHAALFKTIKGDRSTQDKMGQALQDYIVDKKGGFSEGFVNKIQPYVGAKNVGEEMITVMSESILDGTLKYKESFFTAIGDVIRQGFQRIGLKKIKFNTGKDVYNFIKDYNASIEKNYDSKAIDRLFEVGAKGKLVDGVKAIKPTTQYSRSAFENDQVVNDLGLKKETADIVAKNKEIEKRILAEGLKDSNGNIKASPALQRELAKNNLPRAFALARQAAGRAKDLTLDDALKIDNVMEFYSEYSLKLTELANTYRARKNGKEVPFGAYMNTILPKKYSGILEKLKSKIQTDRMSDEATAKKVAKKTAPKKDKNKKEDIEGTAVALETIGHGDVMPRLQDVYSKNKNKVTRQKTYKDVKNAIVKAKQEGPYFEALVEVAEIFSEGTFEGKPFKINPAELAKRIRIKQDLTKPMRKVIQDVILKKSPEMINMIPGGTSASGDATGIANTNLGKAWYDKKGKTKFAETGSRKGLPIQEKRGLNMQTFLAPFGLGEKGNRVTTKDIDGNLREWVMQVATLAMNQASRQADPQNVTLLTTKDGKNPFQFSTSQVNNIVQINSTFEVEYNGKDKLLAFYNLPKTLKINSEEDIDTFIDMLKKDVFTLLPKEAFFGPLGGTSLTSSAKNLGMSSSNPLWKEFVKKVKALNNDDSIVYGAPIQSVDAKTMYSLRNKYSKLFKSPSVIEKNIKNGEIDKFNKEVAAVHKVMWRRIKDAINLDKNAATGIATYLGFVANDTGHWHKLGAQFAGYSKEITGKRYEYEHAMPATAAYLYLLDAALTDGVDFNSAYGLVVDN